MKGKVYTAAFLKRAYLLFGMIIVLACSFNQVFAQSSSQVTIVGIPPILSSPYAEDIESSFVTGEYQVIFNYTSFTSQPGDFVFDFTVSKNNRTIIEIESLPRAFTPGTYVFTSFFEELIFPQSADDVYRQLDSEIQNQIIQTGTIPEGQYTIRIEARPAASSNIAAIPGIANFSVQYPSPPILVSPPNGSIVTMDVPIFAWTPVVNTAGIQLEYDFLLVEVLGGQTPLQAINSNRAHAQTTMTGITTLPYTPEFLPLDEGAEYAWQITASDAIGNVPLQNEGLTEIRTFIFQNPMQIPDGDIALLDEITLIPQFATLSDVSSLSITENPGNYELNGQATLILEFNGLETLETTVDVTGLQIQKTSLENPILMGGSLNAFADFLTDLLPEENPWVQFDELSWSFGQNFTVDASLQTPDQNWVDAAGELVLDRNGLSGTVEISGDPLVEFNEEFLEFELTTLSLSYPENRMWATGDGRILGADTPCELSNFTSSGSQLNMDILCNETFRVSLVEHNDMLVMDVNRVFGSFSMNAETDDLGYDVELRSSLGMKTTNEEYCGVNLLVDISDESGLEALATGNHCPEFNPKIDLGFSSLLLENTEFIDLSYASATGEWDFELQMDARMEIEAFDQWSSLTMSDIVVTREGIEFGEFDFAEDFGITSLPTFNTPLLQLELSTFRLNEFTFPLFNWNGEGPGPWDISFGGNANVQSGSGAPESMAGQELDVSDGHIDQDRVTSGLSLPDGGNFSWNFGPGFVLNFTSLSGIAGLEYPGLGEIRPFGELNLGGELLLGFPFSCGEEQMFQFEQEALSLSEGFSGRIDNVVPECPLQIGPFNARVTQSFVDFSLTPEGDQQAIMDADAVITMPDGLEVDGIVQIDLMTGEFTEASFIIDEPFDWHIPSAEMPVLTFHLDYAELSEEGFFVDGRQSFMLPDTSMGVTFDNFLYDLQNSTVKSGRVIFDDSFAFEVGIGSNLQDLTFQSKAGGSELSMDPGLLMELGTTTYIDSLGFSSSGAAVASVAFNDQRFDSLVVAEYGDDFRMSLNPVGVTAGQVDFYFDDAHFAYLDPSGFHPVMTFFTEYLIPERLPLPTMDIAYLQLREGDSLLVDITPLDDGNIMISTPPDTSLDLVVPYLDPASPPTIGDVTMNDVVITPNPFYAELVSGSIVANLPPEDPTLAQNLIARGIPLTPHYIEYGVQDIEGTPTKALFLQGNLNLFGQELESDEPSEFYLRGDGYVRADINANGIDAPLSLAAEDRVIFNVDSLNGNFEMVIGSGSPVYDFSVSGSLDILTDDGYQTGADLTLRRQPGYVAIEDFTGYELNPAPTIGIDGYGLGLDQIVSMEEFSYNTAEGFQYAIVLNGHFNTGFANGEQLSVPFREFEFRNDGIYIPPQDINESSIPGLNLPSININDFDFSLLAFRTLNGITYTWGEGGTFDPDFSMDFSVDLPEFQEYELIPPDGLLFTNVGLQEGFLVGEMEPFTPLGTVNLAVSNATYAPVLRVEEISGALEVIEEEGEFQQKASFSINGEVAQLPVFANENPESCTDYAEFSLDIIEGEFFEGVINDIQPCGNIPLGPVSMEVTNADLFFSQTEDGQSATIDGGVNITLPAPGDEPPVTVAGQLELNAITGEISDGSIGITEPFEWNMPFGAETPLFSLTVNEALLDSSGLAFSGQGSLIEGDVDANVTFDDLLFDLSTFEILSGSATLDADFAIQLNPNPFKFELVSSDSPMPAGDALRMDLSAAVLLDQNGLGFNGSSAANLQFAGEQYSNLRVEMLNNATISLNGLSLSNGLIEFYWDQNNQPAEEPIAYIDQDGFHLGEGLITLFPARLGLPTEEIAYIQLKDENGDPYIEAESTESGYQLSTDGDFLPIVFPSLSSSGDSLTTQVSFNLETDDAFNVTGGSLTLDVETSLEDRLNLPVSLKQLQLIVDDGVQLEVGLGFDLPSIFNGYDANVDTELYATLDESGIQSGTFSVGEVSNFYNPATDPIFTFNLNGNVNGASSPDSFTAGLKGIEATFGNSGNSLSFAGYLASSLILEDENAPVFFNASWNDGEWGFDLDTGSMTNELRIGQATFSLNEYDGINIVSDGNSFYLNLDGQISLEEILDEPIVISISDLEVGVDNYQISPTIHFGIGSAISELGNQELSLLDGALVLGLIDPTIALTGRELSLSTDGNIQFLEEQIDYTGLQISTSGEFALDEITATDIEIFQDYLVLQSLGIQFEDGIRVESELEITLPAPANEYSSIGALNIYREDGQIVVDQTGLQFDLEERFPLLGFGEFELTKIKADIDPFEWSEAGVYANGNIYLDTQTNESDPQQADPVIQFGEAANFPNNPGIGITYAGNQLDILYNITGNANFEYELSFFTIAVAADVNSSNDSGFEILLSGEAGLNMEQVEASLNYGGIRITEEGLVDFGNIQGGSITVADVATLQVGQFIYAENTTINLADTEEKSPEELQASGDFDSSEVETNSISVEEVLCFGPCQEVGGTNDGSALHLSIAANPNSDSGGISGGVDKILFYKTADGLTSLTIENAFIEIDSIFEMHASINYVQEDGGVLLRAAATGTFMDQVSALVAGKFSNIGGEVSFGLFVAVQADAGVPIVPGVVTLTGAGGGFFYRPVQEDLEMVHDGLAAFGHELVDPESASIQGEADFAVMLYAAVGIAGTGGQYVVEGSTFFQITSQSFYMDARVAVMGLDGENSIAGTEVQGEMSASIQRNPFAMAVGIEINIVVPVVLEGSGGIEFFMTGDGNDRAWGIVGHAQFDVFEGILTGEGNFLAGNPGVMLEVSLGFNLDIPLMAIESNVTGAVWVITDSNYEYPFGAYVMFDVEATILAVFTISAEAKAAFVTKSPGYELFASVRGCVGVLGSEQCGSVWASYSNSDGLGFGTGSGAHADLVAQAGEQVEQFQDHIYSLMTDIPAAAEAMSLPIPLSQLISDSETVTAAGFNFYQLNQSQRRAWDNEIHDSQTVATLPSALQDVRNDVMRAPDPSYPTPNPSSYRNAAANAGNILEGIQDQITQDMVTAYELQASAQETLDNLIASMANSPVQSITKPTPSVNATQSVGFDVNDNLAGQQIQSTQEYQAELELMDAQMRGDIQNVLSSLNEMGNLLQTDTPEADNFHLINMAHAYGEIYEEMERYFALDANKFWTEQFWLDDRADHMDMYSSAILNAIEQLSEDQENHIDNYLNLQAMGNYYPSELINNYARDLADRENFIIAMSEYEQESIPTTRGSNQLQFVQNINLPNPGSNGAPESVQQIHDRFSVPMGSNVRNDLDQIEEINENFWYNMNRDGLLTLKQRGLSVLFDLIFETNADYKEQVLTPLVNITQTLDEFYSIKANITAISYNMMDQYLVWREGLKDADDLDDTEENVTIEDRRFNNYDSAADFLAEQLEPPQITDISIYPNLPANSHYNETDIVWTASHPDEIIETSVNMIYTTSDDTDITMGLDDYLSVGNRSSFTVYPHSIGGSTRSINFGVRVRGSAGNTAIRRGSFTVNVRADGDSPTGYGESIVPNSTEPPAPPIINLSENYQIAEFDGERAFWTNQPGVLDLVLLAYDSNVGIGQWEYSVGTSPGRTDVLDWTLLQGQIEFDSEIPAQRMTGPTQPLNMEPDQDYYISARVRNTLGQVSQPTSLREPILYDGEAPTSISYNLNTQSDQFLDPSLTNVYDAVTIVPPFTQNPTVYNSWKEFYDVPSIKINEIEATDQQSGISHFEYIFSEDSDAPTNLFNVGDYETTTRQLEYTDSELTFGSRVFWHVRAVDNAGNKSSINTFGPFRVEDLTRPEPGKAQAKVYNDGLRLYIVEPPYDPESDIIGIQYAIGESLNGEPEVRPFQSADRVDLEWDFRTSDQYYQRGAGETERYITIDRSEFAGVDGPVYVFYRSVSKDGTVSNMAASGPLYFDSTVPLNFNIQTIADQRSGGTVVNVSNIQDPESGIDKVEYWVENGPKSGPGRWSVYIPAQDMDTQGDSDGVMNARGSLPPLDWNLPMSGFRVKIRITNRVGLTRVKTEYLDQPTTIR
ncbi:hypothetical protein [Rhodohalobacter sp. 614A]|uniref:hypothetical protein n=1 Tax=Rhodohalobacter sp. 614A TaxID=2908649 RepID=UPI001F1F6433|nr:hypothetical protein [Rhodohalobacter sp. 614A]